MGTVEMLSYFELASTRVLYVEYGKQWYGL